MNGPDIIPGGAFQIARSIFESEIWTRPPIYLKTWIWILGQANHADRKHKGRTYRRGELVTTRQEIIKGVSYLENNQVQVPSIKQIRLILDWLSEREMIEVNPLRAEGGLSLTRADTGADPGARTAAYVGIKIIVLNYELYQSLSNYSGRPQDQDQGRQLCLTRAREQELEELRIKEPTQNEPSEPIPKGFEVIETEYRDFFIKICKSLTSSNGTGKPTFNRAYQFVNKMKKEGLRSDAILYALEQLETVGEVKSPWPYAETIARRESANRNEQDAIAAHEALKEEKPIEALLNGLSNRM